MEEAAVEALASALQWKEGHSLFHDKGLSMEVMASLRSAVSRTRDADTMFGVDPWEPTDLEGARLRLSWEEMQYEGDWDAESPEIPVVTTNIVTCHIFLDSGYWSTVIFEIDPEHTDELLDTLNKVASGEWKPQL